jgi:ligand-binding SRPBCC domain-containing protein
VRTIELATRIDAPRERVFDLARHVGVHLATMPGEERADGPADRLLDAGDEVTFHARYFGVPWSLTARVVESDRPAGFGDEQVSGPFASLRHDHRFDALAGGGTRMRDEITLVAPLGPLGRLVEPVIARRLRRDLRARNRALKRLAEGEGWTEYLG